MAKAPNFRGKLSHCKKDKGPRSQYWKCGKSSGGCGAFKSKKN